jgi:O-antigen ligase
LIALGVVIAALVVPLVCDFLRVREPELGIALLLFAAAGVTALMAPRPSHLPVARRGWPLAALLAGSSALAWAGWYWRWTASPAATLFLAIRFGSLAALTYLACRTLRETASRRAARSWIALGGALYCLYALVQGLTSAGAVLWWFPTSLPSVMGTFLNRNHFAVFCELLLPVAVMEAVERRRGRWWMPVVILVAGAAAGSRAGLVLLALETVVLFLLMRGKPYRRLLLAAAVAAPLAGLAMGGDALLKRFLDSEPFLYRDQMWASAIEMARDRLWTGHGMGSFEAVYPAYARFDTGERIHHAHNDWLEWTAEGGIHFSAAWAAFAAWLLPRVRRMPWMLGIFAVLAHALFDYPLAQYPILTWWVMLCSLAVLEVSARGTSGSGTPQKRT